MGSGARKPRNWGESTGRDERAADAEAAKDWVHPAEGLDEGAASAADAVPPALPSDVSILKTLIELVVPPAHYGAIRRWEAGHHRLVVMVYVIAPEYFPGMSREDLGRALGLCPRALAKHFAAVQSALAKRTEKRP